MLIKNEFASRQIENNGKFYLLLLNIFFSIFCALVFIWQITGFVRARIIDSMGLRFSYWCFLYTNLNESALVKYIIVSVFASLLFLAAYVCSDRILRKIKDSSNNETFVYRLSLTLANAILALICAAKLRTLYGMSYELPSVSRMFSLVLMSIVLTVFPSKKNKIDIAKVLFVVSLFVLALMCYEPVTTAFEKPFVMNEYPQINEYTKLAQPESAVGDIHISNFDYLRAFNANDLQNFYVYYRHTFNKEDKFDTNSFTTEDILAYFKDESISGRFDMFLKFGSDTELVSYKQTKGTIEFYKRNWFEYYHQDMSRGQIDHMSYILAPINEYILGKPLKFIYMQYGLGNTLLFKWTMELFGGVSIQNYYKNYLYYPIYFVLFSLMIYFIFKDSAYVSVGILSLAIPFYFGHYMAFILAPGLIPTFHFMHVFVMFFAFYYFKTKNYRYLVAAALCSFLAIFVNPNYGEMILISFSAAVFLSALDKFIDGDSLKVFLPVFSLVLLSFVLYSYISSLTKGTTLMYMVLGFLSWGSDWRIVSLTFVYLIFNYSVLIFVKDLRSEFKYFFMMAFVYSQELLLYYYWSGLNNHLNHPIPFVALTFMSLAYLLEQNSQKSQVILRSLKLAKIVIPCVLFLPLLLGLNRFYLGEYGKIRFRDVFRTHDLYSWDLPKAKIQTTIDPKVMTKSIELIEKYSQNQKSISIISKYDNLLPFLADRYSLMSNFNLGAELFTQKEISQNVNILLQNRPKFLFVDSDFSNGEFVDLYSRLYSGVVMEAERTSRLAKYRDLSNIANAVLPGYRLLEKGQLLSVYERK
jgi:hypothetical protein